MKTISEIRKEGIGAIYKKMEDRSRFDRMNIWSIIDPEEAFVDMRAGEVVMPGTFWNRVTDSKKTKVYRYKLDTKQVVVY